MSTGKVWREYGSVAFSALEYEDKVCLVTASCISRFRYLAIQTQGGIPSSVDGFLGLTQADPQFLNAMRDSNQITKRTFSFYVNKVGQASFIDIGEPQPSNMKGGAASMRYIPAIADDYFWSTYNQGVAFGETANQTTSFAYGVDGGEVDEIVDGATYSIFDSSMPFIAISHRHFDSFIAKLFQ